MQAGVPGLLFHDLRRTAARNLPRAGVRETVIMKIGGGRAVCLSVTRLVSRNDIADAMLRLQQREKANGLENSHIIGHTDFPPTRELSREV